MMLLMTLILSYQSVAIDCDISESHPSEIEHLETKNDENTPDIDCQDASKSLNCQNCDHCYSCHLTSLEPLEMHLSISYSNQSSPKIQQFIQDTFLSKLLRPPKI